MIKVLPLVLLTEDIKRIVSLGGAHHDDDGGHIGSSFRAKKPYRMSWLARVIQSVASPLHLGTVDPDMQIYRLSGNVHLYLYTQMKTSTDQVD